MIVDPEVDADIERLEAWHRAAGAWRPHALSRRDEPMPRAQKIGVLGLLAAAHLAAFWGLVVGSRIPPDDGADTVTTLVFIAPDPPPVVARVRPREAAVSPRAPAPVATPRPADAPRAPARRVAPPSTDIDDGIAEPGAMVAVEPSPAPLRLYEPDGSIALPDDVVERLADVDADSRAFEFRMPGVVESGRFLDRPPALAYQSTRFDQYWIPEKDALTRILEKAVEATTGTVEIPIPGTRGGYLVCSVSILALGGGCGVRNNSDGYVVRGDDPATLSPEEDAQCRAWWDQIVGARDQDAWRHTRALYDSSCRKPLASADAPPPHG